MSGVVAGHRLAKAVLKIEPAVLAVGHHIQAYLLLQRHGVPHFPILDRPQLFYRDFAFIKTGARLF